MPSATRELSPYLIRLRELPLVVKARAGTLRASESEADGVVEIVLKDGSSARLLADVRSSHLPSAEKLGSIAKNRLLLSPYVGAPLGDALAARGINFLDRQGNCHLALGARHVIRIQGRRPPKAAAHSKELRAPGYQVMFALLADPELVGKSHREIAAAAGTSKQPVADLLARWIEEGRLVRRKASHAWVDRPDRALLERWIEGYRASLRPRLEMGRFRVKADTPRAVEQWLEERLGVVRYGGTAGAHRLGGHYRGGLTVVHLGPRSETIRTRIAALPSADGDLVWMNHIGRAGTTGPRPDTVHPLLVYAELACDSDPRTREAAVALREKWLPWSI